MCESMGGGLIQCTRIFVLTFLAVSLIRIGAATVKPIRVLAKENADMAGIAVVVHAVYKIAHCALH